MGQIIFQLTTLFMLVVLAVVLIVELKKKIRLRATGIVVTVMLLILQIPRIIIEGTVKPIICICLFVALLGIELWIIRSEKLQNRL